VTPCAQVAGGNISGVVADPSGAAIPRAKTFLKSLDTQIPRTALANEEGFYAAPNLVPGYTKSPYPQPASSHKFPMSP
jgi:hypothetical protein